MYGARLTVLIDSPAGKEHVPSYSHRTHARRSHAVLGVPGAPLVLAALLIAAPAALAAAGLLPSP